MSEERGSGDRVDWVIEADWIQSAIRVPLQPSPSDSQKNSRSWRGWLSGQPISEAGGRPAATVETLRIPSRGITAIIGGSGSGKSTLLGMLTGLIDVVPAANPTGSSLPSRLLFRAPEREECNLLRGRKPAPGDVGFVFQDAHLLKTLTAGRNAALGAMISPDAETLDVFGAMKDDLSLPDEGGKLLEQFSGGQQQRVAVMRALGMNPVLLVCDEPTSSLDQENAKQLMAQIARWASRPGHAVLWVTHDRALAARFGNGYIGINKGKLVTDHGQPFGFRPSGDDKAIEQEILAHMSWMVPTGDSLFSRAVPTPEVGHHPERKRKGRWHGWLASMRAMRFAFTSSMATAFSDFRRARKRGLPIALLSGMKGLYTKSLTLVLALALIAFYSIATAYLAFDDYYASKLEAPEISHFLVTARSTTALASQEVPKLSKDLAAASGSTAEGSKPPEFFGRRTKGTAQIWIPEGEGACQIPDTGGGRWPMIVYDRKEPLFGALRIRKRGASDLTALRELSDLSKGVVLTPTVLAALGKSVDQADELQAICASFDFGPRRLEVLGYADALPGGGKVQYALAIEERGYREAFGKAPPEVQVSYRDDDGKLTLPAYEASAGYFDYRERERVFCAFLGCQPGETDPVQVCRAQQNGGNERARHRFSDYLMNCDSLGQLYSLIETAYYGRLMFAGLAIAFAMAIVLSTVLAAQALVTHNEKPIAVMRAFRYGFSHVSVLLFSQLAIMFIAALVPFIAIVALFDRHGAPVLAEKLDGVVLTSMSANPHILLFVALGVIILVTAVALLVLLAWWLYHRRVGPVLQSL